MAETSTVRTHKHQLAWQILVPFFVVTALILVIAVLVATGATATSTWADISTIWLVAPLLVITLLFMAVFGFLVYGMARLLQLIPRYTGKVQDLFNLLSGRAHTIADAIAKPFIWFQQAGAILKSIFRL